MAQSVERHLGKVEVTGSIPVISSIKKQTHNGFAFYFHTLSSSLMMSHVVIFPKETYKSLQVSRISFITRIEFVLYDIAPW